MAIRNWFYLTKNMLGLTRSTISNPADTYLNILDGNSPSTGNIITVSDFAATLPPGPAGAQGVAGPTGPTGPVGPVGPAGLNWQGSWSASGTYAIDDAVGYAGASWFCIDPVGPSATPPNADPTNWALLAAQGAQGPQGATGLQGPTGPAGPSGSSAASTIGIVVGSNMGSPALLTYDLNQISPSNINDTDYFKLPSNPAVGKVITIFNYSTNPSDGTGIVSSFVGGSKISQNQYNSFVTNYFVNSGDTVRFTHTGNDFWKAEFVAGTKTTFNNFYLPNTSPYNIQEMIVNTTASALSLSLLNSTYAAASYPIGLKVSCPNISGGGLMYIKTGNNTWVSTPITAVV